MNAKSPKSYQEKFSGDDLSKVSRKFEATNVKKNKFWETAETLLNFPKGQ